VSRATARQISFADWELMQHGKQGVRLEPQLAAISDLLDAQAVMIECIRRDLVRGLRKPGSGRSGLTPSQILRSLVLMRLKNWDYRELRERIADGLTLRRFTDFYCAPVPKHDAFQRSFVRLTPQTLKAVNDLVVRSAVKAADREAYEKSADFNQGQRFRAGIEGRISVLFRGRGMKRCLAHGRNRFELLVGAAVLTNNLMRIADLLARQSSGRQKLA
jgi:Transposase domain (DUF772)